MNYSPIIQHHQTNFGAHYHYLNSDQQQQHHNYHQQCHTPQAHLQNTAQQFTFITSTVPDESGQLLTYGQQQAPTIMQTPDSSDLISSGLESAGPLQQQCHEQQHRHHQYEQPVVVKLENQPGGDDYWPVGGELAPSPIVTAATSTSLSPAIKQSPSQAQNTTTSPESSISSLLSPSAASSIDAQSELDLFLNSEANCSPAAASSISGLSVTGSGRSSSAGTIATLVKARRKVAQRQTSSSSSIKGNNCNPHEPVPSIKRVRRVKANDRERNRMHHLNDALERLKKHLPGSKKDSKMTKYETLKSAQEYIQLLTNLLDSTSHEAVSAVTIGRTQDQISNSYSTPMFARQMNMIGGHHHQHCSHHNSHQQAHCIQDG